MNVVGPTVLVAVDGEAVVEDPADVVAGVAADVVAEQEVGEQQVAAVGEQWLGRARSAPVDRAAPHGR